MKLSIIIPAYNEEENIASVLEKVEALVDLEHELIVVNDYSTDRTVGIVSDLALKFRNIRLLDNKNNKGFANALKFGFAQARNELIVPVMGDLCDDLNTLKAMAKKIDENYDVVCGSRYIKGGARIGGSKVKGFLSSFAGWSLYYLLGIPTHDVANAFKMYRKKVIDSMNIEAKGFEISMEMPLKAYYSGFRITEVPTIWREREKGKSSFRMFKLTPSYLKFYLWGIKKRIAG
ncbi:MAG TPA: glycosyltransferase [Candidatus Omnitrophota bacterium]|nr:glycosyltransferase [Candidatus Omnitrophota bacterium]